MRGMLTIVRSAAQNSDCRQRAHANAESLPGTSLSSTTADFVRRYTYFRGRSRNGTEPNDRQQHPRSSSSSSCCCCCLNQSRTAERRGTSVAVDRDRDRESYKSTRNMPMSATIAPRASTNEHQAPDSIKLLQERDSVSCSV
ncbi:hypothetical protein AND_001267 [Anopheles darlingi]|uniref:Uncharacterized protein n=1 Tax=Anopheles darlingi TaxID=43151 RepID=W5JVR0_ANODA|nr:hypothetical protein AND_001267 [Anopheles darlingi]